MRLSRSWTVVILGFFALSLSFSARSALQVALPFWEAEFGWTRSLGSLGGATALITSALMAILAGTMLSRIGARGVLAGGLVGLAAGLALTAAIDGRSWQFLLVYGGIAAVGFGLVSQSVISTVVAWTFTERRGLATGIATSGATAGQLFLLPALAAIFAGLGWRWAYLGLAAASLVMLALVLILLPRGADAGAAARKQESGGVSVRELATSPVFHALFWSFVICGFTTAGVIETHFIPYATLCGFPPVTGATAYSLLMAVNFGGVVLAGWLSDRMHRPLLLGGIYILRGLAFFLLMNITGDPAMLAAFAVMFGLFDYSTVPVTASLTASHLGLKIMGTAMGLLAAGHALGGAAGAILAGRLFDLFARYDGVWLISVGLAMLAGLISFTIRENRGGKLVPAAA
ncbi:MAG: transporter [Rhodospirillales bacterium]|jgi:MFS family permease|nr:transporter [Rhodospirillales bacterium]